MVTLSGDGGILGDTDHGHEHDNDIQPYVNVGEPRKVAQGANLSAESTKDGEEDVQGDVAELELYEGGKRLAVTDDEERDVEHELERLDDVKDVADNAPKGPLAQIGVTLYGVLFRI